MVSCPVYLEESVPAGVIWTVTKGPYSVLPALTDRTACPGRVCSAVSFWQFQLLLLLKNYWEYAMTVIIDLQMASRVISPVDPCHLLGLTLRTNSGPVWRIYSPLFTARLFHPGNISLTVQVASFIPAFSWRHMWYRMMWFYLWEKFPKCLRCGFEGILPKYVVSQSQGQIAVSIF